MKSFGYYKFISAVIFINETRFIREPSHNGEKKWRFVELFSITHQLTHIIYKWSDLNKININSVNGARYCQFLVYMLAKRTHIRQTDYWQAPWICIYTILISLSLYIYIYIYNILLVLIGIIPYSGGARSVMVIVVGNGHGDTSSNLGRDWLHFT